MYHYDRIKIVAPDNPVVVAVSLQKRVQGIKLDTGEIVIPVTEDELERLKTMLRVIEDTLGAEAGYMFVGER